MNPNAYWIWPAKTLYLQNCYAGFRHDFNMEKLPSAAPLDITADQSYRLYVNGRYICRGPVRGYQDNWPYDRVELLPYLKPGHNWISVEAYNPGISTFAYNHADSAGFLCSAEWDNGTLILSQVEGWTIFRNTAYAHDTGRLSFQMGWQEEVDLTFDDRSWITAEAGFRIPPQPKWCAPGQHAQGSLPWSGLETRRIPMLDEHEQAPAGLVSFAAGPCSTPAKTFPFPEHNIAWDFAENELPALEYGPLPPCRREGNALCFEIPEAGKGKVSCITVDLGADEWLPGTPVFDYEDAEAGMIVDFFYFHWLQDGKIQFRPEPGAGSKLAMASRVHLGAEKGHCELNQIMGVRHVTLAVRENTRPLKIRLSWRSAVYPMQITGNFHCSDKVLNDIYRICRHTQQVCSLDAFVDTPWREQSQWWGDARVQAKNTHFLTADPSLLRQGIHSIAGQHAPGNLTFADAPTTDCGCVLPDFCLTWIATLYDLWFQTGSTEHLDEQKSRAEDIFAYFEGTRGPDGLLKADPRYWLFEDWCDLPKNATPTFLNLWHLYTETLYCKLLHHAGYETDAQELEAKITAERKLLAEAFFDPQQGLFVPEIGKDGKQNGVPSVHDQVLALLLNLRPEAKDSMIEKRILPCLKGTLSGCAEPGSFWSTYLLDAAQMYGLRAEALEYIRREWAKMVPTGTAWETFGKGDYSGWSYSHAWSAHPLSHLPELVFGVKQTEDAWRRVEFAPLLSALDSADLVLPTPQGTIRASLKLSGNTAELNFQIPAGICAQILLPGETIRTTGEAAVISRKLSV